MARARRLRGGAHLDEVAGREEVDGEEHDETDPLLPVGGSKGNMKGGTMN